MESLLLDGYPVMRLPAGEEAGRWAEDHEAPSTIQEAYHLPEKAKASWMRLPNEHEIERYMRETQGGRVMSAKQFLALLDRLEKEQPQPWETLKRTIEEATTCCGQRDRADDVD